jgi:UDP-N-acetylglucosamine 2-epimerase (non-hydrolysing)
MKRIMIIMGTRPEAIKLCPLVHELKKRKHHEILLCSTGQHRSMLDSVLRAFKVKPDFDLDVMRTGQTLSSVTARILKGLDEILAAEHPNLVIVQGDTTTAFAGALAAFHKRIPVAHVEAGLRTYHIDSPYPEEFHRQTIGLIAKWHFAPTEAAVENLVREGKKQKNIFVTGNTVVDALRFTLGNDFHRPSWNISSDYRLLLFTAHRRESMGARMKEMFSALRRLVDEFPDVMAVCPLHHNPQVRKAAEEIRSHERIRIIEPPDILSFHQLLARSYLVITDSGGIQEEAVALGIPTLVTRYATERTEGIKAGVLRLAGCSEEGIFNLGKTLLQPNSKEYKKMKVPASVYGNGDASKKIADILEKVL